MRLLVFFLAFILAISVVHLASDDDEWAEPSG
jgi:hypothetical protein